MLNSFNEDKIAVIVLLDFVIIELDPYEYFDKKLLEALEIAKLASCRIILIRKWRF